MPEAFEVELMLAWGRDWQRYLDAGPGSGFQIQALVLKQYVTMANEALELLKQREEDALNRSGGRPKGTGMGDYTAALIARGVREEDAVRMIAERQGKPVDRVRDALRRYRSAVIKNPPGFFC